MIEGEEKAGAAGEAAKNRRSKGKWEVKEKS